MKKKLAIIGASYIQRPLVEKARDMGLETHVFAWSKGNVVEDIADYYYPVSVLERVKILEICREVGIDGVVSIGSDIVVPTVNFIASELGLTGNSRQSTLLSTDKFKMRKALTRMGIKCPEFEVYTEPNFKDPSRFTFPVIVKPTDRSGSRGVTKVENPDFVNTAIKKALENSFKGHAIVEEFIEGKEFSVEMLSYRGNHWPLAVTDKVTTGAPHFVELEHHQPAKITDSEKDQINNTVIKALNALFIENGASHSEVFLLENGEVRIGEVSGRMGGDLIGSHLVELSTGYDYVRAVVEIAINQFNGKVPLDLKSEYSGVCFAVPEPGRIAGVVDHSNRFENVLEATSILNIGDVVEKTIDSSGKRPGVVVYKSSDIKVDLDPLAVLEFNITKNGKK